MSEDHYKDPWSCSGSAGRWNPKGTRMIYASSSPSTSLLEYLCIKGNAVAKKKWYMVIYEIEKVDMIGELQIKSMPEGWNVLPHGRVTQEFGRNWLAERSFPFLKIPSARLHVSFYPAEHNLLINPDFPEVKDLMKAKGSVPFDYLLGS